MRSNNSNKQKKDRWQSHLANGQVPFPALTKEQEFDTK
jgi:hypothetical protein